MEQNKKTIRLFFYRRNNRGQLVLELTVFGSVLLFLLGAIINHSFSAKNEFRERIMAMRLALQISYMEYRGKGQGGGGRDGNKSRDSANIVFIEDRLDVNPGQFGATERVPHFAQASVTASGNLFMGVEHGEKLHEPVMDIFINGQHFPLTTAALVTKRPTTIYERVVNDGEGWSDDGEIDEICNNEGTCFNRFDLDRDGTVDVPEDRQADFSWQWMRIDPRTIDTANGDHLSVDIDQDLKEEQIVEKWLVWDYQDGDLDLGYDDLDSRIYAECQAGCPKDQNENCRSSDSFWCRRIKWRSGLSQATQVYSEQGDGTLLRVEEGKLYDENNRYIRSTTKQEQRNFLVVREIRLANNTGRFCQRDALGTTWTPTADVGGYKNYVEQCYDNLEECRNYSGTCMYVGKLGNRPFDEANFPVIFVKSKFADTRGRKWITVMTEQAKQVFKQ